MKILLTLALLSVAAFTQAQDDSAFLACAQIKDRNERLQCLDEALNSAVGEQEETESAASVENFGSSQEAMTESQPENADKEEKRSFFRLPKLGGIFKRGDDEVESEEENAAPEPVVERNRGSERRVEDFGRETRVVVNANGEDELHDTVTELVQSKPNLWRIRLASGQVWRQVHPKRYNLKVGDNVRIYPSRWGDDYRLQIDRLNGFIQISRVE
jgi:hypothetical protein